MLEYAVTNGFESVCSWTVVDADNDLVDEVKGAAGVDARNIAVQDNLMKKMMMAKLERGISLRPSIDTLQERGIMRVCHILQGF